MNANLNRFGDMVEGQGKDLVRFAAKADYNEQRCIHLANAGKVVLPPYQTSIDVMSMVKNVSVPDDADSDND